MEQSLSSDIIAIIGAFGILIGLFMSDIGRMRFYLLLASLLFLIYGFTVDSPAIVASSCIFLAVNGYFLSKIPLTLRSAKLPGKLVGIYDIYRHYISSDEFVRIMDQAENKTFMKETLIDENETVTRLFFIITGHVDIIKDDEVITTLGPGNFIGEIGILTNSVSQATVQCNGIVEVAIWNRTIVQHENKLRQLISINLIDKLIHPSVKKDIESR